jgi:asparagine synthase (glutamine-hydrolysing)
MCGIAGIAFANAQRTIDQQTLDRMCDVLAHRGPDDRGTFLAPGIALAQRRLSILDLEHGHQPMHSGPATIVYNGEIYNHLDLRTGLRARGSRFDTRCDTETVLKLVLDAGVEGLARLNGMFGLAIWNTDTRTLVLARDRMGIKPLYYACSGAGDLIFASEIKALFASGVVSAALHDAAVAEYLAFGHVSGTRTLFRDVFKLGPGSALTWRQGRVQVEDIMPLTSEPLAPVPATLEEAAETFWGLFRHSVSLQLLSDAPLGLFLSGGLDSSLILAAMRDLGVDRPQTFAVGYRDSPDSELGHARTVASTLGSEHRECVVGEDKFFDLLPILTWHRDLPITFPASIPLYLVAQLAAEHVKVVLTGEGSDELFAGYGRYPRALWNRRVGKALDAAVPFSARRLVRQMLGWGRASRTADRLFRTGLVRRGTIEDAYLDVFAALDEQHLRRTLQETPAQPVAGRPAKLGAPDLWDSSPLDALLRLDAATYLEELLMKQDSMSMAASLESRVPFLDNDLVAWARHVPSRFMLSGLKGKLLVRHAAARYLPATVIEARKRGFPVPLAGWFRRPRGSAMLRSIAIDRDDPFLRPAVIATLIDEHQRGRDHTDRLWRLLAFQVWRREVVPDMSRALAS